MLAVTCPVTFVNDVNHTEATIDSRPPLWLVWSRIAAEIAAEDPAAPVATCAVLIGGAVRVHFHAARSDAEALAALKAEVAEGGEA
jgi:hypothetical protein